MFSSIYTGLTGLMGFSKGLDIISHNVANLNTPGFKSAQLLFQDLFYQYRMAGDNESALQLGGGVTTERSSLKFTAGELRETGNDADAAIDGNGFFVLRKDGETFYTRDGEFEFDQEGFLIARGNKARVAGLNGASLADISISGLRINPPVATTEIKFIDNLSVGSSTHEINNVSVIDSAGGTHTLKINFIQSANPNFWNVEVRDETGALLTTPGSEIRFAANTLLAGFNTVTFSYAPSGAVATNIVLNFGTPGDLSAVQLFSGPANSASTSTKVGSQNGRGVGSLTKVAFDPEGNIVATYSNGQTVTGARVALAWFESLPQLQQAGGNLFVGGEEQPRLAHPGEDVMGKLVGKSVELSNVELTQQFTDLIILQRGYQASSQVISATNEMVQQLFDLRKR